MLPLPEPSRPVSLLPPLLERFVLPLWELSRPVPLLLGEMGENAKRQDGNYKMLSISILKSIKLHVLLYFATQK